jgi:uncharacterized protein YndB with AHSA1/START domain
VTVNEDPNVTVTVERVIPAPPAAVFKAWLDPQALARFMCPAPGMTVGRVTVDPRVGGDFLIVMKAGDQEMPHHGTYQVIDPPHRLVFSWHSAHAGQVGDSQVTLTFTAAAAGAAAGVQQTHLLLEHRGLPGEAARASHRLGWTNILASLVTSQVAAAM